MSEGVKWLPQGEELNKPVVISVEMRRRLGETSVKSQVV